MVIPAYSCPTVVQATLAVGLKPVFCDVNPGTLEIDLPMLQGLVKQDTLAVIPTYLYGIPQGVADVQATLANSQYYLTWLMRLEGQPKDRWQPEIEASRQTFRLLAGQAETSGDETLAKKHREDLESSIRLARMDLSDLQGLPLPIQ